jgi:hypothetical protein
MNGKSAAFLLLGIGLGLCFGTAVGVASDNLALGLSLGVAIGCSLGVAFMGGARAQEDKKTSDEGGDGPAD